MFETKFRTVGFVMSPVKELVDVKWGNVVSRIMLNYEYVGGLKGLEDFSHAIIVTYLHYAQYVKEKHLHRRPQGREDMPDVGIFAQRMKDRPNPFGVTAVEIVSVGDDYLDVRRLDAVNGTPVLDIKPYYPQYDRIENPKVPEWVSQLMEGYFK